MATNAPPPVYDSTGSLVVGWGVTISYEPSSDEIYVHWHQDAGSYHADKRVSETYGAEDIEDAIASVQRRARILGARRLF